MGKPAPLGDYLCVHCGEIMHGVTKARRTCAKCRRKYELEKAAIRRAEKKAERKHEN
jgi:uncharacterized protein (DUF983 family)